MSKGVKFNVYVGILQRDGLKVVTKLDNSTKTAYWGTGEGKKMPLSTAKDLAWALTINGYSAMVIQTLLELENKEPEEVTQ